MSALDEDVRPAFGKYRVIAVLGKGGMGKVYLVADPEGVHYALKALEMEVARDTRYIHRFLRETRMALKLRHPHIVETFDSGHAPDGTLFMVSEYCPGGDADARLQEGGTLPAGLAVRWMTDVASALDYAWREHRMIHRDVKPANLLFDAQGRIKLADLGLAKRTSVDATLLTAENMSIGTAYYMSPEQVQTGMHLDCRTDLYSLGATFYHLLAGKPMFTGKTSLHIFRHHVEDAPRPLSALRPALPEPLVRLVHRLVEKKPDDRPEAPGALLRDLSVIEAGLGADRVVQDVRVVTTSRKSVGTALEATPSAPGQSPARKLRQGYAVPLERRSARGDAPPWPEPRAWLRVEDKGAGRSWDVAVYASPAVRFGRSRGGEVEMPLRVYPVADNKELCMKISSVHGEFCATDAGWSVTDLGSRNGVSVDGTDIGKSVPFPLPAKASVHVSSALRLECFALGGADAPCAAVDGEPFAPAPGSALVILRPENRRELAYALVRERLPIGGSDPSSALVLPGMARAECGALWWLDGRFWWEASQLSAGARPDEIAALLPGAEWNAGTLRCSMRRFSYDLFR